LDERAKPAATKAPPVRSYNERVGHQVACSDSAIYSRDFFRDFNLMISPLTAM
jgi:hypothetical protein